MHQQLLDVAIRRTWAWAVLILVITAVIPAFLGGLMIHSLMGAIAIWATVVISGVTLWFLPAPFVPKTDNIKTQTRAAGANVQARAAGVCAALGVPELRVIEAEHPSLNVGVMNNDTNDKTIVITSGTLQAMSPTEIESIIAAVVSIHTLPRMLRLVNVVRWITLCRGLLPLGFLTLPLFFVGLPLAHIFIIWGVVVILLHPRLSWWLRVATDGATIATTRYPKPLPNALCKIALYNGPPLPVAFDAWFRGTDLYWLTPLTSNKHPMTTSVNDRVVSKTSSEMDADLRLLLSAQVATEVCMNGRPATLKTWKGCNEAMHAARKHMAESDEAYVIGDYLLDLDGLRLNPNPPDPSTQ